MPRARPLGGGQTASTGATTSVAPTDKYHDLQFDQTDQASVRKPATPTTVILRESGAPSNRRHCDVALFVPHGPLVITGSPAFSGYDSGGLSSNAVGMIM